MYKFFKISFINLIIFSFLVVVAEIFFGYWFDEYNFGPEMRGKRMQKVLFKDGEENIYFYKDFYGFRTEIDDIDQNYDASKIKIIFTGGSTSEEMFLNYEDTIVGNLNKNWKRYYRSGCGLKIIHSRLYKICFLFTTRTLIKSIIYETLF